MKAFAMSKILGKDSSVQTDMVQDFLRKGWTAVKMDQGTKELCTEALMLGQKFFNQSMDEKLKLKSKSNVGLPGYIYYPGNVDGYFQDDTEMFHLGHFEKDEDGPGAILSFRRRANIWPDEHQFKKVFQNLFNLMTSLGENCLEMILDYYGVQNSYYLNSLDKGWSVQRSMRYSPFQNKNKLGHIRVAEHRDVSLFTITTPGDANALQVKDENGDWLTLSKDQDVVLIGAGGILEVLTNGNFKNMFHRVLYSEETLNQYRVSMPYFCWPRPETIISPLAEVLERYNQEVRYSSIKCVEYLQQNLMVPFIEESERDEVARFNEAS